MSKKIILSLVLATAVASPAFAGGFHQSQPQPSLLGGLLNLGSVANVKANVLNTVKADVKVGASQPSYGHDNHGYGAPSSSLADINVVVPGVARANVDIGQQSRHGSTLLGVTANVLSGGVGRRDW